VKEFAADNDRGAYAWLFLIDRTTFMTRHQNDLLVFLRLAGTKSGVCSNNIPSTVIESAARKGGRIWFLGNRVFVSNSATLTQQIRRSGSLTALDQTF